MQEHNPPIDYLSFKIKINFIYSSSYVFKDANLNIIMSAWTTWKWKIW